MRVRYIVKKDYTDNERKILSLCRELDEAYQI